MMFHLISNYLLIGIPKNESILNRTAQKTDSAIAGSMDILNQTFKLSNKVAKFVWSVLGVQNIKAFFIGQRMTWLGSYQT